MTEQQELELPKRDRALSLKLQLRKMSPKKKRSEGRKSPRVRTSTNPQSPRLTDSPVGRNSFGTPILGLEQTTTNSSQSSSPSSTPRSPTLSPSFSCYSSASLPFLGELLIAEKTQEIVHSSSNFVEILFKFLRYFPSQIIVSSLDKDGHESLQNRRSCLELLSEAVTIADFLRSKDILPGDRVLLIFLSSIEFISTFWGCLIAGIVPITLPPPLTFDLHEITAKFGTKVILSHYPCSSIQKTKEISFPNLTVNWIFLDLQCAKGRKMVNSPGRHDNLLEKLKRFEREIESPDSIAYLQFVNRGEKEFPFVNSSEKRTEKTKDEEGEKTQMNGVVVTHHSMIRYVTSVSSLMTGKNKKGETLIEKRLAFSSLSKSLSSADFSSNLSPTLAMERGEIPTVVTWAPHSSSLFMSLMLSSLYAGCAFLFLNPTNFILNPVAWVQACERYNTWITGGPNSAYEYVLSASSPKDLSSLTSLSTLFCNGGEPVRLETMKEFTKKIPSVSLDMFLNCYEMARGIGSVNYQRLVGNNFSVSVNSCKLSENEVEVMPKQEGSSDKQSNSVELMSVGNRQIQTTPPSSESVVGMMIIVDPNTHEELLECQIGEIWVSSSFMSQGFWGIGEENKGMYEAVPKKFRLPALPPAQQQRFLRTGDKGFIYQDKVYLIGQFRSELKVSEGRSLEPSIIEHEIGKKCHPVLDRADCFAMIVYNKKENRDLFTVLIELRQEKTKETQKLEEVAKTIQNHFDRVFCIDSVSVNFISRSMIGLERNKKREQLKKQFVGNSLSVVYACTLTRTQQQQSGLPPVRVTPKSTVSPPSRPSHQSPAPPISLSPISSNKPRYKSSLATSSEIPPEAVVAQEFPLDNELLNWLQKTISESIPSEQKITLDSNLLELGFTSVQMVEIGKKFSDTFAPSIDFSLCLMTSETVSGFFEAARKLVKTKESRGKKPPPISMSSEPSQSKYLNKKGGGVNVKLHLRSPNRIGANSPARISPKSISPNSPASIRGVKKPGGIPAPIVPQPPVICGVSVLLPCGVVDVAGFWQAVESGKGLYKVISPDEYEGREDNFAVAEKYHSLNRPVIQQDYLKKTKDDVCLGLLPQDYLPADPKKVDPLFSLAQISVNQALSQSGIAADALPKTTVVLVVLPFASFAGKIDSTLHSEIKEYLGLSPHKEDAVLIPEAFCAAGLSAILKATSLISRSRAEFCIVICLNLISLKRSAIPQAHNAYSRKKPSIFTKDRSGYARTEAVNTFLISSAQCCSTNGFPVLGKIRSIVADTYKSNPVESAINESFQKAMMKPGAVCYLDVHGSGTVQGDIEEFDAVKSVYGAAERMGDLHVGVMSMVPGNTEICSGPLSILKTLIVLFKKINPCSLREGEGPSYEFDEKSDWSSVEHLKFSCETFSMEPTVSGRKHSLFGAVNGFGTGGFCSHVILEVDDEVRQSWNALGLLDQTPGIASNLRPANFREKKLVDPGAEKESASYTPLITPQEQQQILQLFETCGLTEKINLLGREEFVNQPFTSLNLQSSDLVRLQSLIQQQYDVDLSFNSMFEMSLNQVTIWEFFYQNVIDQHIKSSFSQCDTASPFTSPLSTPRDLLSPHMGTLDSLSSPPTERKLSRRYTQKIREILEQFESGQQLFQDREEQEALNATLSTLSLKSNEVVQLMSSIRDKFEIYIPFGIVLQIDMEQMTIREFFLTHVIKARRSKSPNVSRSRSPSRSKTPSRSKPHGNGFSPQTPREKPKTLTAEQKEKVFLLFEEFNLLEQQECPDRDEFFEKKLSALSLSSSEVVTLLKKVYDDLGVYISFGVFLQIDLDQVTVHDFFLGRVFGSDVKNLFSPDLKRVASPESKGFNSPTKFPNPLRMSTGGDEPQKKNQRSLTPFKFGKGPRGKSPTITSFFHHETTPSKGSSSSASKLPLKAGDLHSDSSFSLDLSEIDLSVNKKVTIHLSPRISPSEVPKTRKRAFSSVPPRTTTLTTSPSFRTHQLQPDLIPESEVRAGSSSLTKTRSSSTKPQRRERSRDREEVKKEKKERKREKKEEREGEEREKKKEKKKKDKKK